RQAGAQAGRDVDARRALRQGQGRRQPEPDRPHLLFRLDADLLPGLSVAGGRRRARRSIRRGADAPGDGEGGLHALPARDRDTVQPDLRDQAVAAAASADWMYGSASTDRSSVGSSFRPSPSATIIAMLTTVKSAAARMQVGVDEAVVVDHPANDFHALAGQERAIASYRLERIVLDAFDELHGEHAIGRQLVDERGKDDVRVSGEVVTEAAVVGRLDAKIELQVDRFAEVIDGFDRRYQAHRGDQREHARSDAQDRL